MKLDSRYSRSFYSNGLSDTKYREIHALAVSIREIKNKISGIVNQDLFRYLEMSKNTFRQALCNIAKEQKISNHFIWKLLDDVYVAYQNKFKTIKHRLKFQHIKEYSFTYYKKNGKTKSGEILSEVFINEISSRYFK